MNKIAQISAKIGGVALSLFTLANIAPADAATFDLTASTGAGSPGAVPTFSVTDGGVTATFSNPVTDGLFRDGDGLRVYATAFGGDLTFSSFDIVFSQPVKLIGYEVGSASSNIDGDETITVTSGGETSVEGPFVALETGVRTFANQITVAAGQVVSVAYSGPTPPGSSESIFWNNLEVTPVPEPASLVGLLGVGALGFASRKRK